MKTLFASISLLFILNSTGFAQDEVISYNKKIKYTFERYNSMKTTRVAQGTGLYVECMKGDTVFNYDGRLISADKHSMKISCYYISTSYSTYGRDYDETYTFYKDSILTLNFSEIESISKENNKAIAPATLFSLGVSGAVFAPLFCIDKDFPKRFNVNRYVEILKYSAVAVVAGVATLIPIAYGEKHFLKPKLITANE